MPRTKLDTLRQILDQANRNHRDPFAVDPDLAAEGGMDGDVCLLLQAARDLDLRRHEHPEAIGLHLGHAVDLVVRQIAAFDLACEEAEHTDVGEVWRLLHGIRDTLAGALRAEE
jgi:hypothetical protein